MRAQSGEHEDACANDRADSQRGKLKGPKGTLQAVFARFAGFRQKHVQGFFSPEICHASRFSFALEARYLAGVILSGVSSLACERTHEVEGPL